MAEGSTPPKERINIRYRPALGNAQEEKELPLKLVMLGDYTLREDSTPIEERKTVPIDKNNFNTVMRNHNLQLDLTVPSRLAEGQDIDMHLQFETLKDFEPEQVALKVPHLKELLELRQALTALKGPLSNARGFRNLLQTLLTDESKRGQLLKELGLESSDS